MSADTMGGWHLSPIGGCSEEDIFIYLKYYADEKWREDLDHEDGLDWPTFCKCDCIFAVPREELQERRGSVSVERRRQIVRAIIQSHGWNAL